MFCHKCNKQITPVNHTGRPRKFCHECKPPSEQQRPNRVFECISCQKEFIAKPRGPVAKRCKPCQRKVDATSYWKYECKDCGGRFEKSTTIGRPPVRCKDCKRSFRATEERKRNSIRPSFVKQCTECGREFSAKYKKAKYCSQKCVAAKRKLPQNTCEECGVVVSTRTSRRCNACYRQRQTPLVATITCLHCKKVAKKRCWNSNLPKYCSRKCFFEHIDACRPESERAKSREYAATRGSGSYRSRCKRYGGYFNSKVTRRAVFERDDFKCYLCKAKVSETLPARHDRKATLDHVVPLEKKGPHDWHNVACCCRKCNVAKRNKWNGQHVMDFSFGWEAAHG